MSSTTLLPARIEVRAPATSANLGPGFDTLGMALDLWNEIDASPTEDTAASAGDALPPGARNLVEQALQALCAEAGVPVPALRIRYRNRVPMERGLGSSAAAIVSGLLLGNACLPTPLSQQALLSLAARLEGHPDNVVPCLLGGVRASVLDPDRGLLQAEVPVATPLSVVVFVPDVTLSTDEARAVLPTDVPRSEALFNVGRVALLVASLASGDIALLREATRDRLHQPYRASLFPTGTKLIKTALRAGALGAWTSGAGPAVCAFASSDTSSEVGAAMEKAARLDGVEGHSLALNIADRGAHVVHEL